MEFRRLGDSGLKVSAVGLGCNNFGMRIDQPGADAVVAAALEHGINFFDTADIYGGQKSEVMLGQALGARRGDVIVATKFGNPVGPGPLDRGGSRRHVVRAVEASLQRLGTDYVDLLQMHVPDADTPIDETLRALDDLVSAGKVRYVGNSNFTGWMIADADWTARSAGLARFVSAQNNYSLLEQGSAAEVIPACERFGLGLLPYFPLASGLLTGKYVRGEPAAQGTRLAAFGARGARALSDANFDRIDKLTAFAAERGKGILDLAFGWLLSQPAVSSVIAGATTADQVAANVAAGEWRLPEADVKAAGELAA